MTNAQLYIAVGLPALAILTSLAINLWVLSGLRADIREIRADIKSVLQRLTQVEARR
jgi:hypothetical protein